MSEIPTPESSPTAKAPKPKTGGFPKTSTPSQGVSVPTIAALALAVIAIALAVAGWFYPSSSQKFSGDQRTEAKETMCTAQQVVRKATDINTNLQNPVPGDVGAELALVPTARLSLFAGGGYLHQRLDNNPATPADLAKVVGDMADTMQALSINYLAGQMPGDSGQQPLRDQLLGQIDVLNDLCSQE